MLDIVKLLSERFGFKVQGVTVTAPDGTPQPALAVTTAGQMTIVFIEQQWYDLALLRVPIPDDINEALRDPNQKEKRQKFFFRIRQELHQGPVEGTLRFDQGQSPPKFTEIELVRPLMLSEATDEAAQRFLGTISRMQNTIIRIRQVIAFALGVQDETKGDKFSNDDDPGAMFT